MKFKTFRALVISGVGVGGLALVGGVYALGGSRSAPDSRPTPTPVIPVVDDEKTLFSRLTSPEDAAIPAATGVVAASSPGLRPMDVRVLAAVEQPLSGGKGKDAVPGQTWKVNLYQDAGQAKVNRLKIDLDRDEKWDEKWSREGGSWKRQVSSRDDDRYDQESWLRDGTWAQAGGAATAVTAAPMAAVDAPLAAGSGALRPLDARILEKARQPIGGDKIKDAFKSEAWKVNIYQDAGRRTPNRLKIDFDRDEKWDEKWDFEGDDVKRHVAPNDDEVYTKEYRLRGGSWVEK